MARRKRLRSVCHSIAHHAVSGLSYIHPHVLRACRSAGVDRMEVNLLDTEPCPAHFRSIEPLRLSLRGLKDRFEAILISEGFRPSELSAATLVFTPDMTLSDDLCSNCQARLSVHEAEPIECTVNYLGEKTGA